jgi:hypothetical protein
VQTVPVDPNLADQAINFALSRYPDFAPFGPRIAARPLLKGVAWIVEYDTHPPQDFPNLWEFLETAVTCYRTAAGV